ncbi:X-ray repair cross-complementing protein 5 [Leptidea sinapis]|uniref:X-ray repair cross-complementing protein 5 n=1 Tax=Leptidea sinapis TaxID=189913 RepID=UPI0021C28E37|nr:X-ray repair cross-complementing protein 5 [Leptidea sinapis]
MDFDDDLYVLPEWRGIPATIVLINIMEDIKTKVIAYTATGRLIRQYMRNGNTHLLGVFFYGLDNTDSSDNVATIQGLLEVIPLSLPNLEDYKKFKSLNLTSYQESKELKLSDVLWHCSKVFANCKKQLLSRKIIMLTQLHKSPMMTDQIPTLKRVKDLVDSNIEICIVNISEEEYKIDPFYINFIKESMKGEDVIIPKPVFDSCDIENQLYRESHRHMAVANLNFEIGDGFSIGVGVYTLLKKSGHTYHKKADLDRVTNAIVSSVTKTVKVTADDDYEDSGSSKQLPLLKSELLFYQEYGGERVEFTEKEMKCMKNSFGPPMLKLLGFKPAVIICKEKWFLKMGYFLFPNEKIVEGSTVAFKALHKACSDMNMVAICVLCPRVNARPAIVGLHPCKNPLELSVEIGFDVIHLPFVENVRGLNIQDETESVQTAHKVVMKDLLNCLQFNYKPDMFENPKLQAEYRAIEAIALEDEDIEPFNDTTKPNLERFQDIKEDLFEELFGPFGALCIKRISANNTGSSSSIIKRAKVDSIDNDLLKLRVEGKLVHAYTVAQLKQILHQKPINGLPALTGLKKNDLIELVYKYFG